MAQDKAPYYSQDDIKQIVLAAFESVDVSKCESEEDLTRKVTKRAITISKMLTENSLESRVMNSVRIYADILSVDFEESSQRYVIKFRALRGENSEPEQIRTPRMDTFDWRTIQPFINVLIKKLETNTDPDRNVRALLYKYNEPAPENAKGPKVPSHGYRTISWLEVY